MIPTEPIHPLKDVWLRPRRVFREISAQPAGIVDYASTIEVLRQQAPSSLLARLQAEAG